MEAGYAADSVSRNDASTTHGTTTVSAAAAYASRVERSVSRASRNAGTAADVIRIAFNVCARTRNVGTRWWPTTVERMSG